MKWILNIKYKTKYKISIIDLIGDEERKKKIINELNDLNINYLFEIKKIILQNVILIFK